MTANKQSTAPTSHDRDGWVVDVETGALIGPDPHLERELTDEELNARSSYDGSSAVAAIGAARQHYPALVT